MASPCAPDERRHVGEARREQPGSGRAFLCVLDRRRSAAVQGRGAGLAGRRRPTDAAKAVRRLRCDTLGCRCRCRCRCRCGCGCGCGCGWASAACGSRREARKRVALTSKPSHVRPGWVSPTPQCGDRLRAPGARQRSAPPAVVVTACATQSQSLAPSTRHPTHGMRHEAYAVRPRSGFAGQAGRLKRVKPASSARAGGDGGWTRPHRPHRRVDTTWTCRARSRHGERPGPRTAWPVPWSIRACNLPDSRGSRGRSDEQARVASRGEHGTGTVSVRGSKRHVRGAARAGCAMPELGPARGRAFHRVLIGVARSVGWPEAGQARASTDPAWAPQPTISPVGPLVNGPNMASRDRYGVLADGASTASSAACRIRPPDRRSKTCPVQSGLGRSAQGASPLV